MNALRNSKKREKKRSEINKNKIFIHIIRSEGKKTVIISPNAA